MEFRKSLVFHISFQHFSPLEILEIIKC
jgi:hypothetical protein